MFSYRNTRKISLNQECRHTAVDSFFLIGIGKYNVDIAAITIGNETLATIDYVIITILLCCCPDCCCIGASLRLSQTEWIETTRNYNIRNVFFLLLGSEDHGRRNTQAVVAHGNGKSCVYFSDFLTDDGHLSCSQSHSAVLCRNVHAVQAHINAHLHDLVRDITLLVVLAQSRSNFLFHKLSYHHLEIFFCVT